MRKALGMLLMLAMIALPAFAGEGHDHSADAVKTASGEVQMGTMHAMNNVYMSKDGKKMAMCGCGKEFEVTDKTASTDVHGMTMYACGPDCAEKMKTATAEEMAAGMDAWHKKFAAKEMASNVTVKDGHPIATCACGQSFEVNAETPYIVEDGMKMHACCAGCANHVMKASAEERHGMMIKAMHTSEKK